VAYPGPDVVRAALQNAVAMAYEQDRQLFAERVNERSLIFHIGRYLAVEVAAWDKGLAVDLEYNRWHPQGLWAVRHKELAGFNVGKNRRVYPDLIVHDRSGSSADHNVLVLEAKHDPSPRDRAFDYRKLAAFRNQFFYRQAVFLEFPIGGTGPRWQWITDEYPDPSQRPGLVL